MSWRALATLVLISWGALTFGAVYPWAYVPLFVGCAAIGLVTCLEHKVKTASLLAASLALLAIAIGLQLVPMSVGTIRWLSPETDLLLRRYALGYSGPLQRHPLSIQPRPTMLALAAVCALALLFLGLVRSLTHGESRYLARGVSVLGALLALVGIVQKAMWNGKIYGFWTPMQAGDSFGPFVNRNHYAGWMLMALPLTLGYFCGRIARGMRHVKPGWRDRLVWLSSADASETTLVGSAVLVMALALTLTMSRSGILGLLVALAVSGWFVARGQAAGSRRSIAVVFLIFVAFVALWWTGFDRLALRFSERGSAEIGGRLEIWADTWRIAGRFPAVGTGLNTFGTATLFYQTGDRSLRHFAEAHNDYLQLLAEGGALVCVPAGLVILAFVRTVLHRFGDISHDASDYWIRSGAVTGILAIALQETTDFSLQMPGNAVLFVVLLALAARHSRTDETGDSSARTPRPVLKRA